MLARPNVLFAAAAAIGAGTLAADAALAPNYQRARELAAVADAVAAGLPAHPVTGIAYEEEFRYRVTAGPCTVTATIVPVETPGIVGPLKFEVALAAPECGD